MSSLTLLSQVCGISRAFSSVITKLASSIPQLIFAAVNQLTKRFLVETSGFDVQKPHRMIHITPHRLTEPQPSHGPLGTGTTAVRSHHDGRTLASPGNKATLSNRAFLFFFFVPFVIMPVASSGSRTCHVMTKPRYSISRLYIKSPVMFTMMVKSVKPIACPLL